MLALSGRLGIGERGEVDTRWKKGRPFPFGESLSLMSEWPWEKGCALSSAGKKEKRITCLFQESFFSRRRLKKG